MGCRRSGQIDGGLLSTPKEWDRAYRLTRRFGRLAARIADSRGATLDTVSDLSRVLRAPDTTNWKDPDNPVPTSAHRDTGGPLTVDEIEEFLDRYCPALGNDEPITGAVQSAPADWAYGQETCKYVVEMIKGWKTDHPKGGRHQWALDRCVRLAAAHRLGCITEKHLPVALDRLEAALKHWCATTEPRRELHHNEVRGDDHSAHPWAVAKVATFTDEQTKAELGGHKHRTQSSEEVIAKDHNLCLPEAFWERECLAQIRQWAWAHEVPADSVLNAALAELSASMPPQVRADTGIMRPLALHHLAGIAGPTGGGKTTMARVGRECLLISPPPSHGGQWNDGFGVRCPDGVDTVEDDRNTVPYRLPLGSGQGICEAYMGMEYGPVGANGKRGKPRRSQIRTNVLVFTDEGYDYVKACRDPKSNVGEVTRALWSGGDAGQGNATAEARRIVREGEYTLAAVAGFQEGGLAEFLSEEELIKGTPQRWIQTWSIDPALPDETPDCPDKIMVTVPTAGLMIERAITDRLRPEQKARARGHKKLPRQESHRPGATMRDAALLAILDGRTLVSEKDLKLAEMLYDTSQRIMEYCKNLAKAEAEKTRQSKRATELAESIADAEMRSSDKGKAAARILALLAKSNGRVKWSGTDGARDKRFKGDDRKHADAGLKWLIDDQQKVRRVVAGRTVYIEAADE